MRKILFLLSTFIFLLCLATAAFFYWRLSPPGNSFPLKANGLLRIVGPEYRRDESFPGVYAAVYGSGLENLPGRSEPYVYLPGAFLHTVYPTASAEEAKELVRKNRETWKNQIERHNRLKQDGTISMFNDAEVFLAPEDSPDNDYLVYINNGQAHVQWASGNWFCAVSADADREPGAESPYTAERAFDFARSLKYAPKGTTPPEPSIYDSFTLYEFFKFELPVGFRYWYPVVVPLVIALPFLLTSFLALVWRRKKLVDA